jgi:hypothetical protein
VEPAPQEESRLLSLVEQLLEREAKAQAQITAGRDLLLEAEVRAARAEERAKAAEERLAEVERRLEERPRRRWRRSKP